MRRALAPTEMPKLDKPVRVKLASYDAVSAGAGMACGIVLSLLNDGRC